MIGMCKQEGILVKHDKRDYLFGIIRESMKELEEKGYSQEELKNIFSPQAQSCYYCKQNEMYEVGRNHKMQFSMMKCDNCDKSYMIDWKKEDEVQKYTIVFPREYLHS